MFFLVFENFQIGKIFILQYSEYLGTHNSLVFQNSPEMNELERDIHAVQFLSKNVEKKKTSQIFIIFGNFQNHENSTVSNIYGT